MAGGSRLGFLNVDGGDYGWDFQIRYWDQSKFNTANVYLPRGWAGGDVPSLEELPAYPVYYYFKGGTWYNPGRDALEVQGGLPEEVALAVSNDYYGVVITIDYRPSGAGLSEGEDIERVYFPDNLEDGARAIQFCRTIADEFPARGGDRPLTRDAELSMIFSTSSGAHRAMLAQLCPDGAFPYADREQTDDPFAVRYSHCCNPIVCSIGQTAISGVSKGGPGYSLYETYGDWSWGGALFGAGHGFGNPPERDWNDIPMSLKRQADLGEYAVVDNPRAHDVGIYFTAPHVSTETPPGNIVNDSDPGNPLGFGARFWRFNGGHPEPIEQIRPVVDGVEAIAGSGTGTLRRASGSWIDDGYVANDIVATKGFATSTNNGQFVVQSRTALDMVVVDAEDNIVNEAGEAGQIVAGGGMYSLHDEAHAYIGHAHMLAVGNTRGRLRAGANPNTNPDITTVSNLADAADVQSWLESEFGWVVHS